jgi:parvulin-like peptidyl-prolyl isomerase
MENFPQSFEANVIAVVDTHKISSNDFLSRYTDYLVSTGVNDNITLREAVLNNMINEIILHNYDDNSKIEKNQDYRKEISWARKETILSYLKDQEIYAKISVTENELREAFKRSNIKLEVRHLYAPTRQAADELYDQLKMGISFEQLSKQGFTDSLLRDNGGYLGYISWGSTDPSFEDKAYSMNVGEISEPIKTSQGYSIIKLENRVINPLITETDFQNIKNKLERGVKISKKVPYEETYLEKIFGNNEIRFDENAIKILFDNMQNLGYKNIEVNPVSANAFCLEYNKRKFSISEIANKLAESPEFSRELLTDVKKLKSAILGLLMQEKLLSIASAKGYDTTSTVTIAFNQIANNIYLNYKRNEIIDKITVPDSELFLFYNKHISYFTSEKEMNVQEIILQDQRLVEVVNNKLKNGVDFGDLAEKYSVRKWSSVNKGEMGLSPVSKFGELKDTLWNAELGKILGPIKFDKYIGFFRVLKKEDGFPIDFSLLKNKILKAVRNEKGFTYFKKHLESLSKNIKIKVNNELLKNFNFNLAG